MRADYAGIPQTAAEAEAEAKQPRDSLPLHRQRMVVYSTPGSRLLREQLRAQKAKKEAVELKRKENALTKKERNKKLRELLPSAQKDPERNSHAGQRNLGKMTKRVLCQTWWGAWQEATLTDDEFPWMYARAVARGFVSSVTNKGS